MANPEKILAAAKAAPTKVNLEEYREAVQELRGKGFTWREIADFLTEQGAQTDHTRVYRTFNKTPRLRHTESRQVDISRITYVGERKTKKNNYWNVMEFDLPSRQGPLTVVGYAWGNDVARFALGKENDIAFRDASLVIKAGEGVPVAYIKAELKADDGHWLPQEVYIIPKWESIL